jgi:hypothetical protein
MALLKLGEAPISSFHENSAAAKLAQTLFEPAMDSLIASHPWRFAQKKYSLSKTSDNDFLIPAEVLRILNFDGEIIGDRIKSPGNTINVSAIIRAPVESYPSYFISLAATKLALEFCIPLSGDQNIFRMLAALCESESRAARFIDSTMSANNDIAEFSLISARY